MTEKRLTDANALIEKMENTSSDVCADYGDGFCQHGYSAQLFRLMVSESPAVDAVEVVHGRWVKHQKPVYICGDLYYRYECSNCGKDRFVICSEDRIYAKYCEECGAKMDGGNEDG